MKQNNYEHIAIFDANISNVASERLRAKQQQNKQHRLLTYSSVAAVSALALLSSAILLPFMKQRDLDADVYALEDKQVTATDVASTTVASTPVNSKLSDKHDLFKYYGSEIEHRSNEEQEQALLALLHQANQVDASQSEEVLKVKELAWNNDIRNVNKQVAQPKSQTINSKATSKAAKEQATVSTTVATTALSDAKVSLATTVSTTVQVNQSKPTQQIASPKQNSNDKQQTKSERSASSAPDTKATSNKKLDNDDFASELTDRQLMYYIVMAETGFTDSESISLVAQIIVNRTKFLGQSLHTVLTSPGQFSCYEDGSYKLYAPTERVKRICDAALNGTPLGRFILPSDTIFYCTVNYYLSKPPFFTGLKRILTHNTQVFFAKADSASSPLDDWQMPEDEPSAEEPANTEASDATIKNPNEATTELGHDAEIPKVLSKIE